MYCILRRRIVKQFQKCASQVFGGSEAAFVEIILEKMIQSAWNMSPYRVERLNIAAVSLGASPVDQTHVAFLKVRFDVARVDEVILRLRIKLDRFKTRHFARYRALFGEPFRESSIEHRDVEMSLPAQHPPQARGKRAARAVVRDYLFLAVDPEPAECRAKSFRRRQGVSAIFSCGLRCKIGVEAHEAR